VPAVTRRLLFPRLGVDLIELAKARAFYRRHQRALGSFLTAAEAGYVRRGPEEPHVRLARLLTAKEAVFKASRHGAWMGPSGFRRTPLQTRGDRLSYRGRPVRFVDSRLYIAAVYGDPRRP